MINRIKSILGCFYMSQVRQSEFLSFSIYEADGCEKENEFSESEACAIKDSFFPHKKYNNIKCDKSYVLLDTELFEK